MYFAHLAIALSPLVATSFAQTPAGFTPAAQQNLQVIYAGNNVVAPPGKQFLTTAVATQPSLIAPAGLSATSLYLIAMIDIDVNMNGTGTTVLHWMQADMQLEATTGLLTNSTTTPNLAAAYLSPGPPPGPAHRYVQILFQQPTSFAVPQCFAAATQNSGRLGFDINQFVATAGLSAPVAGNYIQAINTQAGPAATPVPTVSSVNAALGCTPTAAAAAASVPLGKRLVEVLW